MKRKETTPSGSVGEYVLPEWITNEDRPTKRRGIEDMVSSRDTSGDKILGLGDKVYTPWLLWSATTLEEDEA
jgi:hypothetical protein